MRKELAFFAIPEQSCTYLPERAAGMLFVDPRADIDTGVYSYLIQHGFRRSGDYVYRPKCPNCDACVPIRLPVRDFLPRRSQRRNWKANHGLRVQSRKAEFNDEHYALYERYVKGRHRGGGMDDTSPDQYVDFLANQWGDTRFYEFREGNRLLAVAVVDHLINALSAVYTFFDPITETGGWVFTPSSGRSKRAGGWATSGSTSATGFANAARWPTRTSIAPWRSIAAIAGYAMGRAKRSTPVRTACVP